MRWSVIPITLALIVSGCLGPTDDDDPAGSTARTFDLALPLWTDDAIEMDVPVPVVLIGFDAESADALDASLSEGVRVAHDAMTLNQPLPPDPDGGVEDHMPLEGKTLPVPIVPTARFDVQRLDATLQAQLSENITAWDSKDGDLLEAWLAAALVDTPLQPDPSAPSLILLHPDFEGSDATWRYTFPHGHLEPVRSFGEREPMHIRILSDQEAGDLDHWVTELVHYRFLQGAIYPMPLPECHAITLITAYRPTSVGEHLDELKDAVDLFDPEELERAFGNLTGSTVHVDAKVLELPVDDPVLDLIVRGEFGSLEAQRAWFSLNWQDYHVAHDGCEAYLSFVIHGDLASVGSGIIGIGTYDGKGYRIALSWVNEAFRLLWDPASPANQMTDGSGEYNWINFLHGHEAGHILGMHHPFHSSEGQNNAFQDVWSVMSYSTDGRVIDFSMVDRNNFQRNSAAYVIAEAARLGLDDTPEWSEAFERLTARDWNGASAALWPSVQGGVADETGYAESLFYPEGLVMFPKPVHGHHLEH